MKTPIFRREKEGVKKLIDFLMLDKNYTLREIGEHCGVAESVVWRWKKGVVPRGPAFERLKGLASSQTNYGSALPPASSMNWMNTPLEGRLDQLTKQIADLQESIGVMKRDNQVLYDRVALLEQGSKKKYAHSAKG